MMFFAVDKKDEFSNRKKKFAGFIVAKNIQEAKLKVQGTSYVLYGVPFNMSKSTGIKRDVLA